MTSLYPEDEAKLQQRIEDWRRFFTEEELTDELQSAIVMSERFDDQESKASLRRIAEEKLAKICDQESEVTSRGDVEIVIEYDDGRKESHEMCNTILQTGKVALAKMLTNDVEDPFDFYINSMVFGTNGATGGTPKYVDESRSGLFGTTLLTKNIISSRDDAAPTTAILTSVVTFDEGNGNTLNEMALKMKSADFYSMITFPDLNKTSTMQLTINWRISFL